MRRLITSTNPRLLIVLLGGFTTATNIQPMPAAPVKGKATQAKTAKAKTAKSKTPATRTAKLATTTATILRKMSQIRQLPILHPVKSAMQSRSGVGTMVDKTITSAALQPRLRAAELSLKKLGLVPADFQMRKFYVGLMSEQVAGYYDPKTKIFYVSEATPPSEHESVMAHELIHALQDQHFNLARLLKVPPGNSDAELALHALVEGDATFAQSRYVLSQRPGLLALLQSLWFALTNSQQLNSAPRSLRESLVFPYTQGMTWVSQLHRSGGWPRVTKAFADPPLSSEHILHIDKYLAHEKPIKVDMPDAAKKLGAGWKRLDYDVNGEWSLYLILNEFLEDQDAAKRASAGWGGDRAAVYQGPQSSDVLVVQLTAWDSQKDAIEFYDAYAKRTLLRYKNDQITEDSATSPSSTRRIWNTSQGAVVMERRGSRVLIAEGVPARMDSIKTAQSLWP